MQKLPVYLLVLGGALLSSNAHASDYGCKVLLCLANPSSNGGPMGVTECQPPISQLYHDLDHGKPFPRCDMADGNDASQNYARQVYAPYDPCPIGTQPAMAGTGAVQGSLVQRTGYQWGQSQYNTTGYAGISESQTTNDHGGSLLGPQACVGKLVGSYWMGNQNDSTEVQYNVYDRVVWQQAKNPAAIDVYVDGSLYTRVRY